MLLISSLSLTGGIEQFNRRMIQEAATLAAEEDEPVWVISLLDRQTIVIAEAPAFAMGVAKGSRTRFVAMAARLALWKRPRVVVVGLVNFAPVAFALRGMGLVERVVVQLYGREAWCRLPFHRRLALRHADVISSITAYTAQKAAASNDLDSGRIRLLTPVLDESWLEARPRSSAGKAGAVVQLLTVARLDAAQGGKGVDLVLKALASDALKHLAWRYCIVGAGSDRPRLEALMCDCGLAEKVEFLGAISDEVLFLRFSLCDIFVMPSTQDGFGIVFLEAAAFGKPVIGARAGGIPESVLDGETGILVDAAQPAELQEALIRLLGDPEERTRMGNAGRARVERAFTPQNFRRQLRGILYSPSHDPFAD